MPKRPTPPIRISTALPADYAPLLAQIKARVQTARVKAGLAANRELLALYWDLGRMICSAQETRGYGKRVVEHLAHDLQRSFPGMAGFSPLNVWRMRAFYSVHSGSSKNLSQAVTDSSLPPEPFASLPWGHNILLMHSLQDRSARLWYAAKAVEHGWSRNMLALQIQAGLHERQGKAVTNFRATLPPAQSDLAQSLTKDPYLFDFLALDADSGERAVETGLVAQVEKFLLELGAGFALVGRQIHLEIGGKDFYLDLLFYHLKLRCYVVIDLKTREFTPEAAGKMNFYLSAVDDRFKQADDQPSIGLILCRDKNRVIAEYALRDLNKPIGVSGYLTQLVDTLPKALAGAVPSVAELRRGLAQR